MAELSLAPNPSMWPFSFFRNRSYQQRTNAALAVLLGVYRYDIASPEEKERIVGQVTKFLELGGISYAAHQRDASWAGKAAFRASAMARLDIGTGVDGYSWSDIMRPIWRISPGSLFYAFREFDSATAEAKALLRAKGLEIPDGAYGR